jgi:hypothetical protein
VTGTPTLAIGLNIGSTSVTTAAAVTATSGVSGASWVADVIVHCLTSGTGGTWAGALSVTQAYGAASTVSGVGTASASTAAAVSVAVTATWGTASASNTAAATAAVLERIG